jgi:hypothetical protein
VNCPELSSSKETGTAVAVVFAPRPDGACAVTAEATLSALRALVRGRTSDGPRRDLGAFLGKYGKMVG